MKNTETSSETTVSKIFPALKKLNARTKPTIDIMKHTYLPPTALLRTF